MKRAIIVLTLECLQSARDLVQPIWTRHRSQHSSGSPKRKNNSISKWANLEWKITFQGLILLERLLIRNTRKIYSKERLAIFQVPKNMTKKSLSKRLKNSEYQKTRELVTILSRKTTMWAPRPMTFYLVMATLISKILSLWANSAVRMSRASWARTPTWCCQWTRTFLRWSCSRVHLSMEWPSVRASRALHPSQGISLTQAT